MVLAGESFPPTREFTEQKGAHLQGGAAAPVGSEVAHECQTVAVEIPEGELPRTPRSVAQLRLVVETPLVG
jgi:hypothetical protein